MSNLLWKYYIEDDVERFRRLLANTGHDSQQTSRGHGGAGNGHGGGVVGGSPAGYGASPKAVKNRKASGQMSNTSGIRNSHGTVGRVEINSRDYAGLTILHRAVSSTAGNTTSFALALIEHPAVDLYVQDFENGWTPLHRALYFGNITCARAIIEQDSRGLTASGASAARVGTSVIKVKDREGNSPFDVYNATIARRTLPQSLIREDLGSQSDEDTDSLSNLSVDRGRPVPTSVSGDEVYFWGTNKNYSLGFGDGDDRQHPEKISLKRPEHLIFRFYREQLEAIKHCREPHYVLNEFPKLLSELPSLIQNKPLVIQDVVLSKLHSAILTTDPESNLYLCGFGPGGRLGTGDETTRFSYVCIQDGGLAGKKLVSVALGRDHSLALSSEGEVYSWGTNSCGQLGYSLPRPALQDEEPICATPRQIFGTLKRETVIGIAASAIHSVAYTSTSLFTWGRNEGQLGLMDSDSRSLDMQPVPRKVGASLFKAPITMVSAINSATVCLLANHAVCVFTNYGYSIVKFPLHEGLTNYHLKRMVNYDSTSSHISSITAGGDTIAAISNRGDLYTFNVRKSDFNLSSASTTNPSKIKGALSQPQQIWALRKGHWDGVKSAGVTENGSVIVCTQAGAVWRRVKRSNVKDAYVGSEEYSRKDFKFLRVPGLTNVAAIRSTTFGVYAAIRKDCDITRTQITLDAKRLWGHVAPLLSIRGLQTSKRLGESKSPDESLNSPMSSLAVIEKAVLLSPDIEADISRHLLTVQDNLYDHELVSTSSEVCIPVHGVVLSRSPVLRALLDEYQRTGNAAIPDVCTIDNGSIFKLTSAFGRSSLPRTRVLFQGLDFYTIINLAIYLYTDEIVALWHFTRQYPKMAFRYRHVRVELMKIATHLQLANLESAARLMVDPLYTLDVDLAGAIRSEEFFKHGDVLVELEGKDILLHSAFLCQRCPFFKGLFSGRAQGQWLESRRKDSSEPTRVDLKHVEPEIFKLVLRWLYCDSATEIFEDVVAADIDEFSDVVMGVMNVANELMLDGLAQVCQQVLGKFVTTRNVAMLLNAVAPFSVTEFKDAALEYVCLQLEAMLENHLIDDLDEDLLQELDRVVQANQLNCLPFAKSGRAEKLMHERDPSLAIDMNEERQRRVRDMIFRANMKDDDHRVLTLLKPRIGSVDDNLSSSPNHEKARRKAKSVRNAPFSPNMQPKDSTVDLMFDMDEEHPLSPGSPRLPAPGPKPATPSLTLGSKSPKVQLQKDDHQFDRSQEPGSLLAVAGLGVSTEAEPSTSNGGTRKWPFPALSSSKLGMREIMAQASSSQASNLSLSLTAQKFKEEAASKASALPKLSQRERKKQMQQQALQESKPRPITPSDKPDPIPSSPWQIASGSKTSLKDVLIEAGNPTVPGATTLRPPAQAHTPRRTASPDTRFSGQQRHSSSPNITNRRPSSSSTRSQPQQSSFSSTNATIPHSRSYTKPAAKAEPSLLLSMADIIGQQRREQEVFKEAVAKRSLQEIQEEQAFQEWWDQESKRAQEEAEALRVRERGEGTLERGRGSRRGKGKGHEKEESGDGGNAGGGDIRSGGRGKGRGDGASSRVRGRGGGGRGRGKDTAFGKAAI